MLATISSQFVYDQKRDRYIFGKLDIHRGINFPENNVRLLGTKVIGDVIGKTVKANKVKVLTGHIISKQGDIWVKDCHSLRHLKANEGSINAFRCKKLGALTSDHSIILNKCDMVDTVWAHKNVKIHESIVNFSVKAQEEVDLFKSFIKEIDCVVSAKTTPSIKECTIKVLNVRRATKFPFPPESQPSDNKEKNWLVQKATAFSKELTITLIDSIVKKVIFENDVKGEVILVGSSMVDQVVNGVIRSNDANS